MSRFDQVAHDRVADRSDLPGWFRLSELPYSTPRMRRRIVAQAQQIRREGWLVYSNGRWRGLNARERHVREARFKRRWNRAMTRWKSRIAPASYAEMKFLPRRMER